jgi:hypothetical protein
MVWKDGVMYSTKEQNKDIEVLRNIKEIKKSYSGKSET